MEHLLAILCQCRPPCCVHLDTEETALCWNWVGWKTGRVFASVSGPWQVLRCAEQKSSGVGRTSLPVRGRSGEKEKTAGHPQSRASSSCHASETAFLSLPAIEMYQVAWFFFIVPTNANYIFPLCKINPMRNSQQGLTHWGKYQKGLKLTCSLKIEKMSRYIILPLTLLKKKKKWLTAISNGHLCGFSTERASKHGACAKDITAPTSNACHVLRHYFTWLGYFVQVYLSTFTETSYTLETILNHWNWICNSCAV